MKALVTGATGLIGQQLIAHLDEPVVVGRSLDRIRKLLGDVQAYAWPSPTTELHPLEAFEDVDVIFHLAGESIANGRWTRDKKIRIEKSRIEGTRNLIHAVRCVAKNPCSLVSASAIGIYGSQGNNLLTESSAPKHGFLSDLCQKWETEAHIASQYGVRVVTPRIGIVLDNCGGALRRMLLPFKLGLGGRLGNGLQWMSWIHIKDLVDLLLHMATSDFEGPVNAVSPQPVTNREFTQCLAKTLGRPAILPTPKFALQNLFGEFSSVLLNSQRVSSALAENYGFRFQFDHLDSALNDLLLSKTTQ